MSTPRPLEALIPLPRRRVVDHVDLAAPPERVWNAVRHADLARHTSVRAVLALFRLPRRLRSRPSDAGLCADDLRSTPESPGFQLLVDEPPRQLAAGALVKTRALSFELVHVPDTNAFTALEEPGFVKLAWAVEIAPLRRRYSRLRLELRAGAADAKAWRRFRRAMLVIGPGVHLIGRRVLAALADELGAAELIPQPMEARLPVTKSLV